MIGSVCRVSLFARLFPGLSDRALLSSEPTGTVGSSSANQLWRYAGVTGLPVRSQCSYGTVKYGYVYPIPIPYNTLYLVTWLQHSPTLLVMTAVSAPGKVLLAGGYLVLDRAYTGLVLGLSARIHVLVRDRERDTNRDLTPRIEPSEIVVQSPQFRDATWVYSFRVAADEGGVAVVQSPGYEALLPSSFPRLTLMSCFCGSRLSLPDPMVF